CPVLKHEKQPPFFFKISIRSLTDICCAFKQSLLEWLFSQKIQFRLSLLLLGARRPAAVGSCDTSGSAERLGLAAFAKLNLASLIFCSFSTSKLRNSISFSRRFLDPLAVFSEV